MINIHIAKKLLNQVTPEIREHWEKKNNVSLAESIAEIESIENERIPDEDRIVTSRKTVRILILTILSLFLIMVMLACNYHHIKPVYLYTLIALIFVTMIVIACIQIREINLRDKLWDYKQDRINQQEILSGKVNQFWDTILKVCEHNELPENRLVDAEYLKDVLHRAIKDLLLKQAVLKSQLNPSMNITLDNLSISAMNFTNADLHLDKLLDIIKDKLGVDVNKKALFKKAEDEMRITYPGLSQYFKTTEGQ